MLRKVFFGGVLLSASSVLVGVVPSARARAAMVETGTATERDAEGVKYTVSHWMRDPPPSKTAGAVLAADVDKQFVVYLFRATPCADVNLLFRRPLERAGLASSVPEVASACSMAELRPRSRVYVKYDSATATTSISIDGSNVRASLRGPDKMRAVWSTFFSEGSSLSAGLVSRL